MNFGPKCLACNKPINTWPVENGCVCKGDRCTRCKQLYFGPSLDCLCTGLTLQDYQVYQPITDAMSHWLFRNRKWLRIPEGMFYGMMVMAAISAMMFTVQSWNLHAFTLLILIGIGGGGLAGALSVMMHLPLPPKAAR